MAHRGGYGQGRENSSTAVRQSLKYHPDIIEIDVGKTSDQVLYCYHGGLGSIQADGFLRLESVSWLVPGVETLEEILTAIHETDKEVIVYLDIKSSSITAEDLRKSLAGFELEKIWIAAYSFERLKRLRMGLEEKNTFTFLIGRRSFMEPRLREL